MDRAMDSKEDLSGSGVRSDRIGLRRCHAFLTVVRAQPRSGAGLRDQDVPSWSRTCGTSATNPVAKGWSRPDTLTALPLTSTATQK